MMKTILQNSDVYHQYNYLPIGVFVINNEFEVLFWNHQIAKYTGLSENEVLEKKLYIFFPSFEKTVYQNYLNSVFDEGKIIILSSELHPHILKTNLNNSSIYHTTVSPLPLQNNNTFLALFSVQDQTSIHQLINKNLKLNTELKETNILLEQKVAERTQDLQSTIMLQLQTEKELLKINEELQKAKELAEESDNLKTKFLHNMSHEVRTPMNGIFGFVQFLNDPNVTNEQRSYYSKMVQDSCQQLLRIIDDILEISTLETKQIKLTFEDINLNEFLMELYAAFNLKAQDMQIPLYLKKGLKDHESIITTDKQKLQKILNNLLENSLKYTIEGYIELGYDLLNGKINIYVKDTGIGISPENQAKVFQRFTREEIENTSNFGGLGLGLSIAKENAELIGGTLCVESQKNKGATFILSLPFDGLLDIDDIHNLDNSKADNPKEVHILIAEDESINFLYLEQLVNQMKDYKVQVIHSKNGLETVDICKSNTKIDLVLMDLKMPVISGLDATKEIKQFRPDLPIIAQTAYSTIQDRKNALKAGCNDFISKPINSHVFYKLINKHLKTRV